MRAGHAGLGNGVTVLSEIIREALARLSSALDRLDAVSLRHADGDRARAALEAELQLMREDRHQLARQLDDEKAARVESDASLGEIAPRIDRAIAAIRLTLSEG
jgi:predicted  nucleic acid-binding Zn-ribbon protein